LKSRRLPLASVYLGKVIRPADPQIDRERRRLSTNTEGRWCRPWRKIDCIVTRPRFHPSSRMTSTDSSNGRMPVASPYRLPQVWGKSGVPYSRALLNTYLTDMGCTFRSGPRNRNFLDGQVGIYSLGGRVGALAVFQEPGRGAVGASPRRIPAPRTLL